MSEIRPSPFSPAKPAVPAVSADAARGVLLFVLVVSILYFGRDVLVPVTLALLLAFVLAPVVHLLRRLQLGRVPSVLLAVIFALSVVLAVGGVIGAQIAELAGDLPHYAATVETKIATVKQYTVDRLAQLADSIGPRDEPQTGRNNRSQSQPAGLGPQAAPVPQAATSGETPMQFAGQYLAAVLSPFATFGIVFVVAVFALLQREDLRDRLIRLLGADDLHRTTLAIDDAGHRLSKYFVTQLSINSLFGIVVGVGLLLIGVPNPVLWGILSALLRFVPYVGSAISAILPMSLAAAVQPGWSMVLWTAAFYLIVEGVTGQIIEPMVYGHSTGLSPFSVVVAAIFWSWLWGPIGLILSTPLTLCLLVLGRHVKKLEFLDIMLGNRPALTPIESFYQRILAGDADEAQDHAERFLKTNSITQYYDDVALPGLQLADADAKSGLLDHAQLDRVQDTVKLLIEGLSNTDHGQTSVSPQEAPDADEDEQPPPPEPQPELPVDAIPAAWRHPAAVLCIAGRGPLDEAAAGMLAQILTTHGIGARAVTHGAVSRDGIRTIDLAGVVMVCLTYLDIGGNPAHLRFLMQRLRARLPKGTQILVGLWQGADPALRDPITRQAIGADHFTTSLDQSVAACLEGARSESAMT
jgi:predicted PurR-regulated permease PerM